MTSIAIPAPAGARARRLLGRVDAARICAVTLIVVSLTVIHQYLGPLQHARPSLTVLALFWVIVLAKPSLVRWRNVTDAWPAKLVAALLLLALFSTLFGLSPGGSVQFLRTHYLKVLVFFLVLIIAVRNVSDLALLAWTFVISIGILIVLSMTVVETQHTRGGLDRIAGAGMFDSNDMGMVILMGMPVARLVQQNAGRLGRWISGLVLVSAPVTLALTGSRGALIGFAALVPFLLASIKGMTVIRRIGLLAVLLAALAIAAPAGYWAQMGTTFNTEEDYNYTDPYGRIGIAKRGVGYMLAHPVFGIGINQFPRAEGTISPILAEREAAGLGVPWVSPHNTFVQVGAELGVPGLILWCGMIWAGIFGILKLRRRIPVAWERQSPQRRFLRDATKFLPLSFFAFAITSFFLTHAYTTPIYILLALASGLIVQAKLELRRDALAAVAQRAGGVVAPPAGPRRSRPGSLRASGPA